MLDALCVCVSLCAFLTRYGRQGRVSTAFISFAFVCENAFREMFINGRVYMCVCVCVCVYT